MNPECPILFTQDSSAPSVHFSLGTGSICCVFSPLYSSLALLLVMSGRYQLPEKAVRSRHGESLKGEVEEEAVWDVIVGSCVAE